MFCDFEREQKILCELLKNQIINNNLSHAYLFDINNYSKSFEFVLCFVKSIFCLNKIDYSNCNDCSICKRIDNFNFPEVNIIDPDGIFIKKEQIASLEFNFSRESLESNRRVYIIRECDKMRPEAANALLKFLEEPSSDVIAILMTNNINGVLHTVSSRCQKLKMINDCVINHDFLDIAFNFILNIEKNKDLTLLNINDIFLDKINIRNKSELAFLVDSMIDIYYDILKFIVNKNCTYSDYIDGYKCICEKNDRDNILHKIDYLFDVKKSLRYNINLSILVDSIIFNIGK